ncbi:MAG TPA: TIR domain-containing protein [Thermoanaerobaculia bacterium]|nr:TIR domain-containing protein [Thermoanaerobaculia bacterium]
MGAPSQARALKVFLSYSRRDAAVAERLVSRLEERGMEVLIDRRDLPYGEEWQAELADFIRLSDTVVWLVSPDSVASKWVNWELGEVGRLSKRMVPVRIREIDPEALPESLGKIHLLPAEGAFDFDRHLATLVDTLNTNRAWVKESTRLADRARQWIAKDRDEGLLLVGRALTDAETWSLEKPPSVPPIGGEILELLLNSRRATVRRQRRFTAVALSLAVAGFGLAFFSWQQRNAALARESTYLAVQSRNELARGDAGTSLLLAMAALPKWRFALDRPYVPEAGHRLYDAMLSLREAGVLRGHTAEVNTARFRSDGRLVVTSSDDGTARVWDVATRSTLRVFRPHAGKVLSADFSPDGTLVVTRSEVTNKVSVWDVIRGGLRHTLVGHTAGVTSARFVNAHTVISTSVDGTARIWRLDAPDAPAVLSGHTAAVVAATVSPDGQRVLTFSDDQSVKVWTRTTSPSGQWVASRTMPALAAVADDTGSHMAIRSADNSVSIQDAEGREVARVAKQGRSITSMVFCPGGGCLILTDADGWAELWNGNITVELKGHDQKVMNVAVDPAGRLAATVSLDGLALVWDVATGNKVLDLAGHTGAIFDAAFSPSGELLVTASRDQTARIWRIPAPATTRSRTNLESRSLDVRGDGALVAVGATDGTVRLLGGTSLDERAFAKIGNRPITFVAFDQAGSRLLVGSEVGEVAVYSVPGLAPLFGASTDGAEVGGGGFDPSGTGVSVSTTRGTRFDVGKNGTSRRQSLATGDNISVAILSRDLKRALIGRYDGRTTIVDAGGARRPLKGHTGAILSAVFDEAGRRAATASEDGTACLWNADTGALLRRLEGHGAPVLSVAFSDDGTLLATAAAGFVRLWNAADSSPVATYRGHLAPVSLVRLVADKSGIVSAADDGEIHRWDFADDSFAMLERARRTVPRCLTEQQATQFGLPAPSRRECPDSRRQQP